MDGSRFDRVTRAFATASSRRSVTRVLASGSMALVLARLGLGGEAAADGRCRLRGESCARGRRCCNLGNLRCTHDEVCTCRAGWLDCDRDGSCECGSGSCLHGACTCDPFNNQCPMDADGMGRCTCGAAVRVGSEFVAACVDRNSACDMDKPCENHDDCPQGSVCLLGCADPPAPQPNRCSTPCTPA
jgi:hypothetical protein